MGQRRDALLMTRCSPSSPLQRQNIQHPMTQAPCLAGILGRYAALMQCFRGGRLADLAGRADEHIGNDLGGANDGLLRALQQQGHESCHAPGSHYAAQHSAPSQMSGMQGSRARPAASCRRPWALPRRPAGMHVPSTSLPCRTTQVSHWQDRPDVCRKRICDRKSVALHNCGRTSTVRCPSELMYIPQQGDQAGRPHKPSPAIQLRTNRAGLKHSSDDTELDEGAATCEPTFISTLETVWAANWSHLWSVPSPRMKMLACAVAASDIMRLALEIAPSSDAPDCDSVHGPSSANLHRCHKVFGKVNCQK